MVDQRHDVICRLAVAEAARPVPAGVRSTGTGSRGSTEPSRALENKPAELPDLGRLSRWEAAMMVDVRSAWNGATGVRGSSTSLRAFPTCRAVLLAITTVIESNNGGLRMRFSGRGQQTGGRRLAALAARWLVDGSIPARGRREWACARRSVAGIRLPVSPERGERRESSSSSPSAFACAGQDGGAVGRGLPGFLWRLRLPMSRRADGSRASTLIRGTGTGGRAGALARSRRCVAAGLLLAFTTLLALPPSGPGAERPDQQPRAN